MPHTTFKMALTVAVSPAPVPVTRNVNAPTGVVAEVVMIRRPVTMAAVLASGMTDDDAPAGRSVTVIATGPENPP